ncbi:hypothetical protein HPP92_017265 [Vanilla planifolia]|uniref:Uncharacterized protein n=1 Tax=Vanilla planifolia TaxID=51239 RepID=A0A835QHP8_VANPL|nr:hypothetical protein HPP92_017265 [Vanilla planifolia]
MALQFRMVKSGILCGSSSISVSSVVNCGKIPIPFGKPRLAQRPRPWLESSHGTIPQSITRNCNLRVLDLPQNVLLGSITQLIESFRRCIMDDC